MSITTIIDYDKIAPVVLSDVSDAVKGWLKGRLTEEVALTNRIIEHLVKQRRGCDIGVDSRVTIENEVAILHRKGQNQVDLFGSDLALTIYSSQVNFVNTAFFQFKIAETYRVTIEKQQLEAANVDPQIANRSFVFAVDEARSGLRLERTSNLLSQFTATQKSKTFDTRKWMFLVEWLWKWLSCDLGVKSNTKTQGEVESLLRSYVSNDKTNFNWVEKTDMILKENYLPARAWLVSFVTPDQQINSQQVQRSLLETQ